MEHDATPTSRLAAGLFTPAAVHRAGDGHALLAPVLVLNASYEPINVCAARRALVLVLKGVAMTEEENGHFLHSARVAMRLVGSSRTGRPPRVERQPGTAVPRAGRPGARSPRSSHVAPNLATGGIGR